MKSASRPLGGISALTLGVVSAEGTAPSLPDQGVQFRLLEDRSIYTQTEVWSGGERSVKHSLLLITPFDFALSDSLEDGLTQGFAALVVFNSLDQIELGAEIDSHLWLSSCTTYSEENRSSRGYKEWLFETLTQVEIDADDGDDDNLSSPSGVTNLKLCVVPTSSESPNFDSDGIEISLFGDLSTYDEKVEFVGAKQRVDHSLSIYTAVDYSLPSDLEGGLSRGFAALLELNSGCEVSVGWSEEAGADRPLRLVSCSIGCSTQSDGIYYKEWLFESTDGVSNI